MKHRRIAIVGGGASGTLVAARILDASHARPVHVTIVDPAEQLGAGIAYGTDDPDHLLNVRASGMSADPSDPDDLLRWARRECDAGPDTFVARRDFRRYLQEHLQHARDHAADAELEVVRDVAWSLTVDPGRCELGLGSGASVFAERVVLAIGNPPPGIPPSLDELDGARGWVPDPWAPDALRRIEDAQDILLVGTGLTMVDVAITLGRQDVPGRRMIALSRHGLVPAAHLVHQQVRPLDVIDLSRDGDDVRRLSARLRAQTVEGVGRQYDDEDWREVVDAVRPFANALWQRFDDVQRRIFLTEELRRWDVHRHRMSPATAARLADLRARGHVQLGPGRVLGARTLDDGRVQVDLLMDGLEQRRIVDAVVNCTGPGRHWEPPTNPLVADLIERGSARPDPLGLGLWTTPRGELRDAHGATVPEVLVIGPPRRGSLFETTAVPELRSQALHIADLLTAGV